MTRRSSTRSKDTTPAASDVQVTPEEGRIESPVLETKPSEPVTLEVETLDEEPVAPPPAASPEELQTDFREKLAKKSTEDNVFVPSNPVALEKAATEVAKEQGFDFNRGTSIGARLMARAQKRV
jgi:hypothetical protein